MTLTTILASSAGVLAIAAAGALMLPRQVRVERSAVIDAAPKDILELAASNAGYQRFNPYKTTDANLKITLFGPADGVGSGFAFDGKDGTGTQTVAEVTPDHVRYAIDLGRLGQPAQTIAAFPEADGTRVTWVMEADLGLNPVARIFGLFMDGMIGKTFDQGLTNLNAAL